MTTPLLLVHRADGFYGRLLGLLARPPLAADEALYLAPCRGVHTAFMHYPIDVAFVDRDGRVLRLVTGLAPFRAAWCWRAHGAIEFMAGAAIRHGAQVGGRVALPDKSRVNTI